MILEEKLITLRKSKGYSQDDLANKLDVSRQAVYKWEAGQAIPDISKLKILSSLYNVSIDNLLNNNEDIIYMNTPKSRYGEVIVKKTLDGDAAEKDNVKLLPDEEKKVKTRKRVLDIAKSVLLGSIALAILFFILSMLESNEDAGIEKASVSVVFILISIIVAIIKKILSKAIYPNVQFARTYFNQELEKANKELNEKYGTVYMLQRDLLAWFVYDNKSNSFGFYFDGEMQFFCPINNYASITITKYTTIIGVKIRYFNSNGELSSYDFTISSFRQFWVDECKTKEDMETNQMQLDHESNRIISEIKQRLDAEKSRI